MAQDSKLVIATASSPSYFDRCLNLIGSIRRHNAQLVQKIVVYDLGLLPQQLKLLSYIDNVLVKSIVPFCPHYLVWFAWKPWAILDCITQDCDGVPFLFLDAGIQIQRSLSELAMRIQSDSCLLFDSGNTLNRDYTSNNVYRYLGVSREDDECRQLMSGIQGYLPGSGAVSLVVDAVEMVKDESLIRPTADCPNNRHEQSVLTTLAYYRYPALKITQWLYVESPNNLMAWEKDTPERIQASTIWLCRNRGEGHISYLTPNHLPADEPLIF